MLFNQNYQPYLSAVAALALPGAVRGIVVAAATAAATAATLQIPAEPVINPEAYFNQTHALSARHQIGVFNDIAVLNYEQASALVRKFWLLRYSAAHGTAISFYEDGCFAECFSGIKHLFSPEELQIFNENTAAFGRVRQAVATVLKNVKQEQDSLIANNPNALA